MIDHVSGLIRKVLPAISILACFSVFQSALQAQEAASWQTTKNLADDVIYSDHKITFYCGCTYQSDNDNDGSGKVDDASCGYQGPSSWHNRAERMEWEHVVPAALMPAHEMDCWKIGGRKKCEHDPVAKKMIFDLNNLVPSIGQVNVLRSNDRYAVIPGEGHEFGACTAQDSKGTFEPRDSEKGDVARIWLYMHDRYGVVFQIGELEMFQSWNETDPVSDWEIERDRRIVQVQGFGNPWVENSAHSVAGN